MTSGFSVIFMFWTLESVSGGRMPTTALEYLCTATCVLGLSSSLSIVESTLTYLPEFAEPTMA